MNNEPQNQSTRSAALSEARIEAAATWFQSDDSAYENEPDAAKRAAREMLRVADEIEARFEAATRNSYS